MCKQKQPATGNGLFERSLQADFDVTSASPHVRSRGGSLDRSWSEVKRKTSGGTMDEESFISQFSVRVEVEVILSPRHLDQEVVGIHSSLTDTDWTSKVTGFQTVRGLVNASASFADQFVEKLKYIETPMLTCLKDLRSQVVRECCVTIAYIAQQFQYKVDNFLAHLLPALISLIQNNVKVISSSAIVCIRFILHNTYSTSFLPIICTGVTNKSLTTRRNIYQFLEQILHVWPLYILEASSQTVQDALRLGLSDQDSETRSWARKAFWAFADHFKLESDLLLSSLDQALQGDNLSLSGDRHTDRASVRSRQSSIARSNESLDSLGSERPLERLGSLRGKRRSCSPLTPPVSVQRSNSALDPAAARRAAVRQQYSQSCRSKIQRTGSLRRNSEQPARLSPSQRTGSLRRNSDQPPRLGLGRISSTRSNSIAITPDRTSQTSLNTSNRSNSIAVTPDRSCPTSLSISNRTNSISSVTSPTLSSSSSSMLDLANKTASLTRNMAASLGIKIKTRNDSSQEFSEKHVQFKQCDGSELVLEPSPQKTNHQNSRTTKPNGILTNKQSESVKHWDENQNSNYLSKDKRKYSKLRDKKNVNTTEEPGSKEDLKVKMRQILTFLEDSSVVSQDLARLAALELTLSDTESLSKFPHLTAGIFKQLVVLSSGSNKEVARNCQTVLHTLLATLPFNQSVTLLNNTIRTDTKERAVVALKNFDRLLQNTEEKLVKDNTKDIILGLLKGYESTDSGVRKHSVTGVVTLHTILGEPTLQPYLESLPGPKRKLLSLYILRQKQKM